MWGGSPITFMVNTPHEFEFSRALLFQDDSCQKSCIFPVTTLR